MALFHNETKNLIIPLFLNVTEKTKKGKERKREEKRLGYKIITCTHVYIYI